MSFGTTAGLVSGIDYNSIISQTRAVNSRPITLLQRKQAELDSEQAALQSINQLLTTFRSASDALSGASVFRSAFGTTSDSAVLGIATTPDTPAGSYSVVVKQLAQAERIASQGVSSLDSAPIASAAGTFEFKVGDGDSYSIDVSNGMTLEQLRDEINNADTSVRASIINDGTATNAYRLVLSSTETGASNDIQVLNNDTTLDFANNTIEEAYANSTNSFNGTATSSGTYTGTTTKNIVAEITQAGAVGVATFRVSYDGGLTWEEGEFTTSSTAQDISGGEGVELAFTADASPVDFAVGDTFSIDAFTPQIQKAQNAVIVADGIQVSRSSNTFEDVIEGVTLTAKSVSEDPILVSVTETAGTVDTLAADFVSSYNDLVSILEEATAYNVDTNEAAALFGDTSITTLRNTLNRLVTSSVPGLTGEYTSFSSIGITLNENNTLSFDSAKFKEALDEDPDAVKSILLENATSSTSTVKFESSEQDLFGTYGINITTAAERAEVSGGLALGAGGLTLDERLVITINEQTTAIDLTSGSTIEQIVSQLNARFEEEDMQIQAANDGGVLKLTSIEYGSEQEISVFSNRGAAEAGQLGIGTTSIKDTGVDVVGTINGLAAEGVGQKLTGTADEIEGLELLITATAPTTATLTMTQGISSRVLREIDSITDSENGLFAARATSYSSQSEDINDQITALNARLDAEEERMKAQFVALETRLSQLNSEGDFLLQQLSAMI